MRFFELMYEHPFTTVMFMFGIAMIVEAIRGS